MGVSENSGSENTEMVWVLEGIDEYCMSRGALMAEVNGGRVRGIPRLSFIDGVKVALGNRGMTVEFARQFVKVRNEWRALVHV